MSATVNLRALLAFATGFVVALIGVVGFQSWRADAFPGEFDTTFRPITACRLIDTRPPPDHIGPASTFGPDDTKTVAAVGSNGKCTIPPEAVALTMNVTAVGANELTFITIWPGNIRPLASSLNPAPGQPPTPNAVSTNLTPAGTFKVYNESGNVDLIIDITGYHIAESLIDLDHRLADIEVLFGDRTGTSSAGDGTECTLGEVKLFAGAIGVGRPADGALLQINEHDALFALMGTTFGGDGRVTFGLPDLRGAAPNGHTYFICDRGVFPARRG